MIYFISISSFSLSSSVFIFILSLLFPFIFCLSLVFILSCFSSLACVSLLLFSLIFSLRVFSSLLFSLLFSSLVLSLLFHLLLPSFLVSSSLVSSSLCLSFSVFSSLSFSLCLRVMFCVLFCGVCCWWSCCVFGGRVCVCVCVCLCVLRHAEKNVEKTVCGFKNASVCTFKMSPCMPAHTRRHVFQHVHAWCRYTRETFRTCTRRRYLNFHTRGAGGHRRFCLPVGCTTETLGSFPIFKFEKRLRTTCPRFLQSFALTEKAVQLQLSQWTLRRESATRWFDWSLSSLLSPSLLLPSLHHHHHNQNHEHHNNTQHTETERTHTQRQTLRQRDRDTETQRDFEGRQNPSFTNDLHDLPKWFHVFFFCKHIL